MRLLLDSHTLLWAVDEPERLSPRAASELQNPENDLILSAATIWEIAIKVGLGKLSLSLPFRQWMTQAMADLGLAVMPITVEYADAQTVLPLHHRDPFDRLLVAQAQVEGVSIVSSDSVLQQYGVSLIW